MVSGRSNGIDQAALLGDLRARFGGERDRGSGPAALTAKSSRDGRSSADRSQGSKVLVQRGDVAVGDSDVDLSLVEKLTLAVAADERSRPRQCAEWGRA